MKLGLGPMQEGTGTWLVGAFELALGRHAQARDAFAQARESYLAANAPGLVLLTEGYLEDGGSSVRSLRLLVRVGRWGRGLIRMFADGCSC